ncbi:MAG: antitoxin [Sulfuricaulis sp.]
MKRTTAKVFTTGRSQAVRLPKNFRFEEEEVYVRKEGNNVILSPRPESWDDFFRSDLRPTEDFMSKRTDLAVQKREAF